MSVSVGGAVVLLLAVVSLTNRKIAIVSFLLTIPFKELGAITAIGRTFRPAEILVLVLALHTIHQIWMMSWAERRAVATSPLFVAFALFGIVCIASTIYAYLVPPTDVLVHPYNLGASFGAVEVSPFEFGRNNITQLLMRLFYIGAILSIAITFNEEDIIRGIRWVVCGSILGGVIGVIYQVSILMGETAFIDMMHQIGFMRFPPDPVRVGPLPRMYSIQGEPGTVANMLLLSLAMMSASIIATSSRPIFSKWSDVALVVVLAVLILASTGTTGYGGMAILAVTVTGSIFLFEGLSLREYLKWCMVGGVGVAAGVGVVAIAGLDLTTFIEYTLSKIQFKGGSGSTRIQYLLLEIDALKQRPVLGLGVGSHQSTSVFGTIVTDVGILGFTIFLLMHAFVFGECVSKPCIIDGYPISSVLFVGGVTLFLTNLLARDASSLYFGWYWVSVGFPIALHRQRIVASLGKDHQQAKSHRPATRRYDYSQ